MNASPQPETSRVSRWTVKELSIFALALLSPIYAVLTAPGRGIDLINIQNGVREWMNGAYQIGEGSAREYPPFILPLLSPIALLSRESLVALWLALNIAATVLILYFVIELWGRGWPVKARLYLSAFFITWAPFRVTLRNGQISLIVMALLLGALLARKRQRYLLAGALMGLSLCKYSLTFPFFLYFVWKREWKTVFAVMLIPAALTQVFAARLGLSLIDAIGRYINTMSRMYMSSGGPVHTGTSEIKPLVFALIPMAGTSEIKPLAFVVTGANEFLAAILIIAVSLAALISMAIGIARRPQFELAHFAALALFGLWSVYHRTYDSVLCLLPAALFVDFLIRKKFVAFSRFWLIGLALLVVSVPGLLTDRLGLNPAELSSNPLFFLGIHIERLLIFGMFWSLIFLIWRSPPIEVAFDSAATVGPLTVTPESPHPATRE